MMIKAVLFDLDGTLLPMEQEPFIKAYFGGLAKKCAPHGYEPKALIDAIWKCTGDMVRNNGARTNESVFWDGFVKIFGEKARADEAIFDAFYKEEFDRFASTCGYDPRAAEVVHAARAKGLRTVLATNPIFPEIATRARMRWAGLSSTDFELFTTYENSCFAKPNKAYYRDVCARIGLSPEECLMVGNDMEEDMVAAEIGMQVFLLTGHVINRGGRPIEELPHGDFDALLTHIEAL